MSVYCPCGHRISEVLAPDGNRADFIRDQDIDALSPHYGKLIDSFVDACLKGKMDRRIWLNSHFGKKYPDDIRNSDIIWDIRNNTCFEHTGKMYLCGQCGGLLVEYKSEHYKYFTSSDDAELSFVGQSAAFLSKLSAKKKALRQQMLALRDAMDPTMHATQSAAIRNELRALIRERKVRVLHSFLPMSSEVDLYPLLDELLAEGIAIYAPKTLKGRVLENYRYQGQEQLVPGVFGTRHPAGDEPYTGSYDMILVPGLAFTAKGDRLGYGAGYYDTFLKQHPSAYAVAVCFPLQVVAALPVEAHDHPVELVVTGED